MSEAITFLCRPLRMSPHTKAVLMCLADYADDVLGVVPASHAASNEICAWTGLRRSAAENAVTWLTSERLVVREGGGQIRLNVARLAALRAACRPFDPADDIE